MSTAEEFRLRFNILGPIEGWSNGERLRLGGVIQERVLATLLLEPGKVLPVSRLVEAAWDEDPPTTASHQVRKAVADLRRRIPGGAEVLVTDGPGYRVDEEQCEIDVAEFGLLIRNAKLAASDGRAAEAAEMLRGALELWRGPVLGGGGGPVIERASTSFEERRMTAAEQRFDLRLALGDAAELVVELRELAERHPLRESLRGQLMLALYRSGRQAEALDEYGKVRELLADELGIDPGPHLTKLYEGILRESPELAGPEPAPAAAPVMAVALPAEPPSTLPYDLADFTGRDQELAEILDGAKRGSEQGPLVVAIDGMGGCGKTSLAVRAAHRLAPDYPDGQLHLDLRGHTPGDQPVTAGIALDTLLRAVGVPGQLIPDDVPARTALWRSTLLGKRMLILFDNAADAAAIHPLLPLSPGSLVMVTSRARLVDLDGAQWISIGEMSPEDSAMLVAETLGTRRVAAEPEAAAELARLCGHLPLALRIATARLRNRPRWTLQYLAERLRDETRRLDELSSGARSVSATLRLSYQALDEECRHAFSTLSLHPGNEIDAHAAGALLGVPARDAEDLLEMLLDVHLVQQPEIGLYTFHDLVRSFAQSLFAETPEDSDAVERLLGYYLTTTEVACDLLYSGRRRRSTGIDPSTSELPALDTPQRARAWFRREQGSLLAAVTLAERRGHDRYVVCLARNLVFQLNDLGLLEEFGELSRVAVAAADRLQDLSLLGVSLSNLGVACWKLGRLTEGLEAARRGRDVAVELGDLHTQAHSESILGQFNSLLGDFPAALEHMETAIAHERDLDMPRAEAESLTILSTLYEQWGRYEEAREAARRSADLSRRLGQHEGLPGAITDLAFAHVGLGAHEEADRCLTEARALYGDAGNEANLALTLALSADVEHRLGKPTRDPDQAERALDMMRTNSSPLRRAKVENVVGRLRRRQGDTAAALELHRHAHELAASLGYRVEQAYALTGMADALGDDPAAARYREEAEQIFTELGVPAQHRRC
ncbi:BTAD domain-containing putative transcriptional regulator [Streptomyces sp. NPDC052095]|uniref:AfsR/SARP family transcriptional regulator n=1 Tax=unclassified Streptomyces TaxID=2593676 RepID=UPI00344F2AC5